MLIKENLVDQAKRGIIAYIFKENLSKGSKLPSIEQLAVLFTVGRSTVREAIRSLVQLHILEALQGKGTFVAVDPASLGKDIARLSSVTEMAQDSGIELSNLRVQRKSIVADAPLAQKLAVEAGTPLVLLQRTRGLDGEPIVYLEDILPEKVVAGFSEDDWNGSLFRALERNGTAIAFSHAKIIPYYSDVQFMSRVGLKKQACFLLLEHLHYDHRDRVIAFSNDYYHGEYFHFEVLRKRL
ncbi:MAG TPA: GntR family transcriptional regulator [Atribacteraceae bacterium]|nr:GntR family transcriptional regulator [Atribacteraceae bacterium]